MKRKAIRRSFTHKVYMKQQLFTGIRIKTKTQYKNKTAPCVLMLSCCEFVMLFYFRRIRQRHPVGDTRDYRRVVCV